MSNMNAVSRKLQHLVRRNLPSVNRSNGGSTSANTSTSTSASTSTSTIRAYSYTMRASGSMEHTRDHLIPSSVCSQNQQLFSTIPTQIQTQGRRQRSISSSSPYTSTSSRGMVTITKTSASEPLIITPDQNQSTPQAQAQAQAPTSAVQVQQNDNSLTITESAVRQIHHLASLKRPEDPSQAFLRVYVDAGGCSGFQYKFEIGYRDDEDDENAIDEDEDVVIHATAGETQVCVVVDESSLGYIRGSTIDFVREMIRSSFAVVDNPQSESACGCGSSFAVKNFEANPAID